MTIRLESSLARDGQFCEVADAVMNRLAHTPPEEVQKLLAEYPEHCEQLQRLLPAMLTLVAFGREGTRGRVSESSPAQQALGDFRLLREIGRGGMGVVYEAEQLSLPRRVAVKILPLAAVLDDRALQRFKHEAAAAAMLKHPHIVSIYSVGCDRGVYYYAMELINGQSLAQLIGTRRLSGTEKPIVDNGQETVQARFDSTRRPAEFMVNVAQLGIQAAEALEEAHQNGIVHRDVKPSNLMIDNRGHLWVTDFGLAQIESGPDLTLTGDLLGTLRYMSPEQAAGRPAMVDHRTDIYSLGATLYELVTDRPVVEGQDRAQILRAIAEKDPANPRSLNPSVPVDLETILLKCLAKEPSARYETAEALAGDLRRFLEHKPVVARRPGSFDQLAKWSRRHRGLVAATAIVLVTLVAGVIGTTWGMLRALDAEREAQAQELAAKRDRDAAVEKERIANDEAAIRAAINEFLQFGLLAQAAPELNPRDKQVTVEELLDRAAATIDDSFNDRPHVEAAIRKTIGDTYLALGKHAAAQHQLEASLAIYERLSGVEQKETLDTMSNLAEVLRLRGELGKAAPLAEQVLSISRRVLGQEHDDTLTAINNLASIYASQEEYAKAQPLFEESFDQMRKRAGASNPATLTAMNNLGLLYSWQGENQKAEQMLAESLKLCESALGAEHPDTLSSMNNLGAFYKDHGRFAEAEPLFVQALEIRQRVLGAEAPATLTSLNNLASLYFDQGQFEKAEPLFVTTLDLVRRVEGKVHPHTLTTTDSLAKLYVRLGKFADGEALLKVAISDCCEAHGKDSRWPALFLDTLGEAQFRQDRYPEAEQSLREFLELKRTVSDDWNVWYAKSLLGAALVGQQKDEEAEPFLVAGYEGLSERMDAGSDPQRRAIQEAARWLADYRRKSGNENAAQELERSVQSLLEAASHAATETNSSGEKCE